MIDLHIHSNYSDGSLSVKEILQEAEKRKLEVISITDHDCVKAYEELKNINVQAYYNGKIIIGCEFKCFLQKYDLPIEILGYGINLDDLNSYFENNNVMKKQKEYLKKLKQVGKEIGLVFNERLELTEKHAYASAVFQEEILKHQENKEIMRKNNISIEPNFYRAEQCNKDSKFFIDEKKDFIDIKDMIEQIHKTGGLAFLAHPYIYVTDDNEEMVKYIIKNFEIDGIECCYSTFSEEQTEKMLNLCKKSNLYISGGTDFHGKSKPDIKIGIGKGNLKIEKEIINNWISKI